jgi:hypothetical protein
MRLLRDQTPRKSGIGAGIDSHLLPPAICGDRPCRDPAPVVIPEDFNRGSRGIFPDSRLQSARMTMTPRDGSAINPVLECFPDKYFRGQVYRVAFGNNRALDCFKFGVYLE